MLVKETGNISATSYRGAVGENRCSLVELKSLANTGEYVRRDMSSSTDESAASRNVTTTDMADNAPRPDGNHTTFTHEFNRGRFGRVSVLWIMACRGETVTK